MRASDERGVRTVIRARDLGEHLPFQTDGDCEIEADYAVVGSGAGGAAAALTLARAGYRVALCESGAWREPADYPSSFFGALRDLCADWGTLFSRGRSLIPVLQGNCVGGTTVINSAIMVRLPGDVLAEWQELGLGDVFGEGAFDRVQDEIEEELGVEPMAGPQLGTSGELMLAALRKLKMEGHAMRRAAPGCEGRGQCLQGCSAGRKSSLNLQWVPETLSRGGALLSEARVERVRIKDGRALGVSGHFRRVGARREQPRKGSRFVIHTKRGVLLAASSTGTAPLLQRSGYRHAALGRNFMAQPGAGILGVYPDAVHMERGTTQGVASMQLRESHGVKLESLSIPLEILAARVAGAGVGHADLLERYPHMAMWAAAVRAEARGTIRPSPLGPSAPPTLRYEPTRGDTQRLRAGILELARLHFAAGAQQVLPGVHGLPTRIGPDQLDLLAAAPLDNRCWTWVLTHLFGGCVMGADKRHAVVGTDLCVRGVDALHVVDASCLPTTLGVNPQLTIMSVARLVAERLANETTNRSTG
jgi:choline dehydrogenase-like flavoprotein